MAEATKVKRILVVEDDTSQADQLRQILSGQGFQVDVAFDGYSALSQVRAILPDLLVLDAVLPKVTGFHLARLIKFDEKLKKIPILMLTVLNQQADKERGKQVGVDLYLTKPFTEDVFVKAVQNLVKG